MDKKIDNKMIIIIILVALIILLSIGIIFYININNKVTKVKGTVNYVGKNYILLTDDNNKEYNLKVDEKYSIGDELELELTNVNDNKNPIEANIKKIEIISRKTEQEIKEDNIKNDNNTDEITEEISTNSTKENTSSANTIIETNDEGTEEDVISYLDNINNNITNNKGKSITESIKSGFVTTIDFLFYDGVIKGKTFKELSNSAKLKALKIALSIDSKIDEYFPDYKKTLSSKYQNLKSKIVSKYLDITADICSRNEETCTTAKEDFANMKKSFSLTWTMLKDLAGTSTSKLKSWYEIWRYK